MWAPASAYVVVEGSPASRWETPTFTVELAPEGDGYFSGFGAEVKPGDHYKLRLDSGLYPDPASHFQPDGPHGASQVLDGRAFRWTDQSWAGLTAEGQVLYELHIGTFTPEGTWQAAAAQLQELARLGITAIEVMPVAEFPGRFGWGYDGVNIFAPTHLYGTPDDFRTFVDQAHAVGIGVILDVVYNHLGPDGNYLRKFAEHYFSETYKCEWGEAINFDGEQSAPVREFFLSNAVYWIREFHLDGLRLDATQQIFDASKKHIIAEIAEAVREAAGKRSVYLVGENEPQEANLVRPISAGGSGLDALWNDDFHHAANVAVTGKSEAYYTDYRGTAQELVAAAKWGFLYQGQHYRWHKSRRGTPSWDLPPTAFVNFLQNHDQIANSALGARLHTLSAPGQFRAMTTLFLLMPGTPMLFQGQEFNSTSCFHYFADHQPELAALVAKGRCEFLSQFPSVAQPETVGLLRDPGADETFLRCKLDFKERERHAEPYLMHRDLLRLRREDAVFSKPRRAQLDGAVFSSDAFVLRYFGPEGQHRLLFVNLGSDLELNPSPEPLLAPLVGHGWQTLWSSEDPRYGGAGTPPLETNDNWRLPGHAAVVLTPKLESNRHD
ncbi:MAG TPA: malto-oligosyltrehalose trehalohydrolase [Chthoniobacteraceae bacterium]